MLGLLLLAGCQPAPTAAPDPYAGVVEIKLLATVPLSPTPGDDARQATQAALVAQPTAARATSIPTPTPYVGIFLGETGGALAPGPELQPARLATSEPLTAATITAQSCTIAADARFGQRWQTQTALTNALGCAGEPPSSYNNGSYQIFENGLMLFIPSGDIWAIAPGSPTGTFWYVTEAPPAQPEGITPPEGLRIPTLGFGAVWAAVPGVRQALGFARTDETTTGILVQRFIGGELIQDSASGQTFGLVGSGATGVVYGPF
jgi:hypothetical protein